MKAAAKAICVSTVRRARIGAIPPPVPEELCRAHLERIASGVTFARAEQLRRLLQWLGERSLVAPSTLPLEKEIAENVLGRKDFDPQTDSLVRKEMSRLREKLQKYYEREGARESVRIQSAGGYLFRFTWSESTMRELARDSPFPSLLVLPLRAHPDLQSRAIGLAEELLVRLGEQGGVQLVSPTTALSYMGRAGDVREFAAECGADFVLEGSLELSEARLRVTLWLVNGRSGRTQTPGRFAGSEPDQLVEAAALWLRGQFTSPH